MIALKVLVTIDFDSSDSFNSLVLAFRGPRVLIDAATEAPMCYSLLTSCTSGSEPALSDSAHGFRENRAVIRRYSQETAKEGNVAWTSLNEGVFFEMCTLTSALRSDELHLQTSPATLVAWRLSPTSPPLSFACSTTSLEISNTALLDAALQYLTQNKIPATLEVEIGNCLSIEHVDVKKNKRAIQ